MDSLLSLSNTISNRLFYSITLIGDWDNEWTFQKADKNFRTFKYVEFSLKSISDEIKFKKCFYTMLLFIINNRLHRSFLYAI